MNRSLAVPVLAKSMWHDFLRTRHALFIYEALFKFAEAWLVIPAVAVVLATILSRAGHVAVSNLDILDFLASPLGLLYTALFIIAAVAALLIEQAGVMVIAAGGIFRSGRPFQQILRAAFEKPLRIAQLGAVEAGVMAGCLLPLWVLGGLAYVFFFFVCDIYFYFEGMTPPCSLPAPRLA